MTQFRTPEEAKPGRRRIVEPAGARPLEVVMPPPAFEEEEQPIQRADEEHPLHALSYVEGLDERWFHPLSIPELYDVARVTGWDTAEVSAMNTIGGPIGAVELAVNKWAALPGSTVEQWRTMGSHKAEDVTDDFLRSRFGAGQYKFFAYALHEKNGRVRRVPFRQWKYQVFPIVSPRVQQAPPAAPAAPAFAQMPQAFAMPAAFAAPSMPGMPAGMPVPQTAAEWAQMQAILATIEQQRLDADERRAKIKRDEAAALRAEAEAKVEKQRADLMYQQQFNQMMAQQNAMLEAQADARQDRKDERAQASIDRIKELEQRAHSNASTDPVEKIKGGMEMLEQMKVLLGNDDGERNRGGIERAFSAITGIFQSPVGEKLVGVAELMMTNRAKIAEMEMQLGQMLERERRGQQPPAPAPRRMPAPAPVVANPVPVPAQAPQAAPVPPAPPPATVVEQPTASEPIAFAPTDPVDSGWAEEPSVEIEIVSETIENPAPSAPGTAITVAEAAPESEEDDDYEDCPLCLANPHDGECPHSDEEVDRALALLKKS